MSTRFKPKVLAVAAVAAMLSFTPTHAKADPGTLIAMAVKAIAENIVMVLFSKTLMTYALLAAQIYGGIRQRRKAKRAAAAAKAAYNASLTDRTAVVLSAIPPWQIIYGTQEVPGSIHALFTSDKAYVDSSGNSKLKKDALHHMVYVWTAHECSAVLDYTLGGETCGPFDANGYSLNSKFKLSDSVSAVQERTLSSGATYVSTVPLEVISSLEFGNEGLGGPVPYTLTSGDTVITNTHSQTSVVTFRVQQAAQSSLRIRTFLGSPTQAADPVLMALFPDKWTSNHRLRGRCYSVVTVDVQDSQFQGGPPAIMARLVGKSVYDPRTLSTGPSTNAALCIRDWLLSPWGAQASTIDVDDTYIAAAANACDQSISIKTDGYTDNLKYDFTGGADGFTGTGCTVTASGGLIVVDSTGNKPRLTKSSISVSGASSRYVRIRIRRVSGTGWRGSLYYSNGIHGFSDDYRKDISGGLVPGAPGPWAEFVFDMHSLTTGAGDWQNTTITGIRLDLGTSPGDVFEIDWVAFSQYQEQTVSAPRYTINAFITADQNREAVLTDMANTMAGTVSNSGKWIVNAGVWTAPVKTFGDNDLDGQIEFLQTDASIEDLINSVQGAFYKNGEPTPVPFEAYINTALVAADGEELMGQLDLPYVDNETRARNLARIEVEQSRSGQSIRIPLMLHAWPVTVGERITVNNSEYGLVNKTYRIVDWAFSEAAPVTLVCQEDIEATYDEADTTLSDPSPNSSIQSPAIVRPVNDLTAVSGNAELLRASDGTILSRVKVTWSVVPDPYMVDGTAYADVAWRRPTMDAAGAWRIERVPALQGSTYLTNVRDGESLVIGVRTVNSVGMEGPWEYIPHTVEGKTAAPTNISGLAYVIKPSQVQITFAECPDVDFSHVLLRTGASFAAGGPLVGSGETVVTGTSFNWPRPANGTYTVWAVNVDTSGNISTPQSVVVTVSDTIDPTAASSLTLIPRNGVTVIGNDITRTSGGGLWDADCYSNDGHTGGAYASARFALVGEVMFGLNSDPSTALDYTNIDYALYGVGDGRVIVYESGANITQIAADCTAFDVWAVVYDGTKVVYTRNGYVAHITYPVAPITGALSFDSSFATLNARLNSVQFGPLTNNTWTSIGGKPADAQILKNLINPAAWVPGSTGSQTGFAQNGVSATGENYIAYDTVPDGSVGILWRARSGSDVGTSAEGGWDTTAFKIDETRMYRFRYWVRVFGANASGLFLLGPGAVYDIGGGFNGNQYFIAANRNSLPDSEWCLVVGYVYPSGYGSTQMNRSGVWRLSNGVKIIVGTDYRWAPGQTETIQRAYQYYTNQAGNYQDFFDPRVELCDGTETPIDQLLAKSAALKADAALIAAADAQATADGKIDTYWQDTAPSGPGLGEGDIWFDTNDGYKQYRYTSGSWVLAADTRIGQAITAASDAQATADGKIRTFVQGTAPTAEAVGDLWVHTGNSNIMYRWDGDSWEPIRDSGIASALSAANDAQATADGKINTYWQNDAPVGPGLGEGDIWFDTNDGYKQYRYTSSSWVLAADTRIGQAITAASDAQATADGKIVTFVSATAPTAEAVGDLWIDTANGNAIKRWNGGSWEVYQLGTLALTPGAATEVDADTASSGTWTIASGTARAFITYPCWSKWVNNTGGSVEVDYSGTFEAQAGSATYQSSLRARVIAWIGVTDPVDSDSADADQVSGYIPQVGEWTPYNKTGRVTVAVGETVYVGVRLSLARGAEARTIYWRACQTTLAALKR